MRIPKTSTKTTTTNTYRSKYNLSWLLYSSPQNQGPLMPGLLFCLKDYKEAIQYGLESLYKYKNVSHKKIRHVHRLACTLSVL